MRVRVLLACILAALVVSGVLFMSFDSARNIQEKNEYGDPSDMPVEMVISRRMSIHYQTGDYNLSAPVSSELVSQILWAACGYSSHGRTVPSLSGYPVVIYVCNETAAYKFVPENQSLFLLKEGDYRGLGGYGDPGYEAPIQLYIVYDANVCPDTHWGNAETGCAVQSIYLMANALNLGTVCCGGSWLNRTEIHEGLGLPANEVVRYKMPLGYPLPPYNEYQNLVPTSRPSSPELPEIQDSNTSIEGALDSIFSSHEWSENLVTKQELSQILWASYGYSYYEDTAASPPERHRTVPSAGSKYPMTIYAANSSGVYEYLPEQHTITTIVTEGRRPDIAAASGNPWASSAPLLIATAWDENNVYTADLTYVEVGLIAQNVYLECAAWGLIADWGKADVNEEAMREALGIIGETNLHPASIMAVGHPDVTPPTISILSPENKRYTVSDVALTFTISEATSWIGYSLDGEANVTITGNKTLPGLSDGIHTVIVYANDTAGNMGHSDSVDFTVDTVSPIIEILSPENKTYTTSSVSLSFTIDKATSWIGYSLDGEANVTIAGNTTLTGLSDGIHSVTVYANGAAGNMGCSDIVYFTVQTAPVDTTPPTISIVSPENKTHDTTDISLTFTVDEPVSWIGYSLDGQANVTITGNVTLSGIPDGLHSLVVYARDTTENTGASETIYFSIRTQQVEPFPATWIVATIVLVVGAGAALAVYLTKVRKKPRKPNSDSEISISPNPTKRAQAILREKLHSEGKRFH